MNSESNFQKNIGGHEDQDLFVDSESPQSKDKNSRNEKVPIFKISATLSLIVFFCSMFSTFLLNLRQTDYYHELSLSAFADFGSVYKYQQSAESEVTAVFVTCCHRHSHLYRALKSFIEYCEVPLRDMYVVQDGALDLELIGIMEHFPQIKLLTTGKHEGQVLALDFILQRFVKTKYYFYSEDDWEIVRSGLITNNIQWLEKNPKLLLAWNRPHTGPQMRLVPGTNIVDPSWKWAGFSFNPAVNRLADYQLIEGGYSTLSQNSSYGVGAGNAEYLINKFFKERGYYIVQNELTYYIHLGGQDGSTKQEVPEIELIDPKEKEKLQKAKAKTKAN